MMNRIIFAYPGYEEQARGLAEEMGTELGLLEQHRFPDGDTLVRIGSSVEGKEVVIYCSLDHPDTKAVSLMFFSETAKELGAKSVTLIAPYLGYMRQDKRFREGEAITSNIFAKFLSTYFDRLITVDPHLHRHKWMDEIYTIPTQVIHAADEIAIWVKKNVDKPVIIGPDEESAQWVADVAERSDAEFAVLSKARRSDTEVEVTIPDIHKYIERTPVLVDDIISTAHTMIESVKNLKNLGMKSPVCIGIHAIFAGASYQELLDTEPASIVTCNTIPHLSNSIDLNPLICRLVSCSLEER